MQHPRDTLIKYTHQGLYICFIAILELVLAVICYKRLENHFATCIKDLFLLWNGAFKTRNYYTNTVITAMVNIKGQLKLNFAKKGKRNKIWHYLWYK